MKPIEQFLNLCSINWRLKGQLPSQAFFTLKRNACEGGREGEPTDALLYLFTFWSARSIDTSFKRFITALILLANNSLLTTPLQLFSTCRTISEGWVETIIGDVGQLILKTAHRSSLNYCVFLSAFYKLAVQLSSLVQKMLSCENCLLALLWGLDRAVDSDMNMNGLNAY